MTKLALIDGDSILYKAGFSAQRNRHWVHDGDKCVLESTDKREVNALIKEHPEYTVKSETEIDPIAFAYQNFDTILDYIFKMVKCDEYELFLSGEGNYRKEIATIRPYKGHRNEFAKPYYYDELYSYAVNKYSATVVDGQEAEDAIGIINQEHWEKIIEFLDNPDAVLEDYLDTIIVHIDKDLDQLPGWHYNFDKQTKYCLDENDADFWFYCQILAGDSVDNIQGIPGMGIKTAEKLLQDNFGDEIALCNEVIQIYIDYGRESEFLETAQLVRIRRYEEEIWLPPTEANYSPPQEGRETSGQEEGTEEERV